MSIQQIKVYKPLNDLYQQSYVELIDLDTSLLSDKIQIIQDNEPGL